MKDTDTIGVADGEGQDMGEVGEACVPVSELREKAREWQDRYDDDEALPAWESGDDHGHRRCARDITELADKYDSNE